MAEAVVSHILPVILEKLASPLIKKFISSSSVEKDIDKLLTTFLSIQDVVEDAEEQHQRNRRMKNWLGKLKEVTYDIDNIFDELTIEDLRSHVEIGNDSTSKVCNNFSTPSNPFAFHYQMGCKIGEVVDRLDLIAKERLAFNLRERSVDRKSHSGENRETHSFVHEAEVYGRNDDREKLVELLINMGTEKEGTEDLSIVPIVGMGGLGKTTLAQFIYNDERVKNHFDQRMWAYVSEDFELVEILRAVISSTTEDKCDLTFLDPLGKRLQSILSGKKYLLVLDDVWNEDVDKWGDFLKILLKCGDRGSKVIVTTRSEIVASVVGTLRTYFLEPLPEDDCWSLFKKRAFPKGDEQAFPNLVTIGEEIVKRCGGLPLAVGALGGLLHYKRREEEWLVIKESNIWKVDGDKVISVLRLSYDHLSSPLKQCFAYCSIFPKGYAFERFRVIQLWIAEGFIQRSNESRLAEDIGEEYFDMLCLRSLFQKVEKIKHEVVELELLCRNRVGTYCPYYYNMVQFRMHDLVCDLARSVAETECSVIEGSECLINKSFSATGVHAQPHHISYLCKKAFLLSRSPSFVSIAKKQRTFILVGNTWRISNFSSDILNLSYLRVLDLSSSGISELPESIGKLQLLRLLDMSDTHISKLPESIDTLWLLQTLRLLNCVWLRELPEGMSKMVNLRHLEISTWKNIEHVPSGLGQLTCLQTLPLFIVGKERGCGIGELKGLNLRGRLVIKSLQNVLNPADAERAGLKEKQYISNLHLSWEDNSDDSISGGNENYQHVIENLEPHPNIEKLEIENFMGLKFPTWLTSWKLPKLIAIGLKNFRCDSLPSFSKFPFLKVLSIEDMPNLELQSSWSSWPSWSSWSSLSSLERVQVVELVIIGCPKLTRLPNLPSLQKLRFERSNVTLFKFIFECRSLVSLNIGDFPELTSLPQELQYLTALESLCVVKCPKLVSLPESIQKLMGLTTLWLDQLPELACLPEELGNLSSLEVLTLIDCPNILQLPTGLKKATTLHHICIVNCPHLTKRCSRYFGEDWYKIEHVPIIQIFRDVHEKIRFAETKYGKNVRLDMNL